MDDKLNFIWAKDKPKECSINKCTIVSRTKSKTPLEKNQVTISLTSRFPPQHSYQVTPGKHSFCESLSNVPSEGLVREKRETTTPCNLVCSLKIKQPHAHGDDCFSTPFGDGLTSCRICGSDVGLRTLDDGAEDENCFIMLEKCFGVNHVDQSIRICSQCDALIRNTCRFKEMVTLAFQPNRQSRTTLTDDNFSTSTIRSRCSETPRPRRMKLHKKPSKHKVDQNVAKNNGKKTFLVCTSCRQKYPMMSNVNEASEFVCSRCKIKRTSDRTVECAKCKVVIPARLMREHLDGHTRNELQGRCRLRSLSKKPSKAHTSDQPRKSRKIKVQCNHCFKKFSSVLILNEHTKAVHGDFLSTSCHICGKDMQSKAFLEKHMKIHAIGVLFECDVCGRIFKNGIAFQKHRQIHSVT